MDERALSVLFLLTAGVLPLRELAGRWAGRRDRRALLRALTALYLGVALAAVLALILTARRETPGPEPMDGPEQFALHGAAASGISIG